MRFWFEVETKLLVKDRLCISAWSFVDSTFKKENCLKIKFYFHQKKRNNRKEFILKYFFSILPSVLFKLQKFVKINIFNVNLEYAE